MTHEFEPTILREYDIRGIVGQTLSTADARAIGQAFAVMLATAGGRRVAGGFDGRLTSPEFEEALVDENVPVDAANAMRAQLLHH